MPLSDDQPLPVNGTLNTMLTNILRQLDRFGAQQGELVTALARTEGLISTMARDVAGLMAEHKQIVEQMAHFQRAADRREGRIDELDRDMAALKALAKERGDKLATLDDMVRHPDRQLHLDSTELRQLRDSASRSATLSIEDAKAALIAKRNARITFLVVGFTTVVNVGLALFTLVLHHG